MRPFLSTRVRQIVLLGLLSIIICVSWAAKTAVRAGKHTPAQPSSVRHSTTTADAQRNARQAFGRMPLSFEANRGQTDPAVNFIAHGPGYNLFLTPAEAVLVLQPGQTASADTAQAAIEQTGQTQELARPHTLFNPALATVPPATVLRMQLVNAADHPTAIRGDAELPGKVNYLSGSDPQQWRTNIPTYGQVRYEQVYPGVDMVYYGNQQQLEYDFVVAPGANPDVINLNYDGVQAVKLDGAGGLLLGTAGGMLHQHKPVLYQLDGDKRKEVQGKYVRRGGNRIGFQVTKYDRRKPLIIDPILSYSSFVNSAGEGIAIAVDPSGNAYLTGVVAGTNPPIGTPGAYQIAFGGLEDAFVTKINQAGDGVFYTTYLGGSGDDYGNGITFDVAGNAYIAGGTSGNFPTTAGAYQTAPGGGYDGFIVKLNPTGSGLVFSTLLGGNGIEECDGIAVDANTGNVYVSGLTTSSNLNVTPGAFRATYSGGEDGYAAKLNATGTSLLYLTYVGGSGFDYPIAMTADSAGNVYLAGQTNSLNFPTQNAVQGVHANGSQGLFKSSNSGGSWTQSNSNLPTTTVYAIAINPTTPSTIYAGTEGGVFKTTNSGGTWNPTGVMPVARVRQLLIDPTAPNTVYAGTSAGVYKTTDGGNTWVARNNGLVPAGFSPPFPPDVRGLALHPSSPNTVYAAGISGVFKTTDGGANWTQITSGLASVTSGATANGLVIDPSAANTLYVIVNATQRVFKTTNGGTNWTAASSGLPTAGVQTLAINPTTPSTLYAGTTSGIYRTTNGGTSWSAVNAGLLLPRSDSSTLTPSINSIAIDPTNPSNLYAAPFATAAANGSFFTFATIFKSTDGGNNWTAQTSGFNNENVGFNGLAVDPVNPANVYAGNIGAHDGFLVKLNPTGTAALYSTFLGGERGETASGVALDAANNVYVSGTTRSPGFPTTAGAFQTVLRGSNDNFVTKFNAAGTALVYSTFLGSGNAENNSGGMAVDTAGNAYVTGSTFGADFPVTPGAFQTSIANRGNGNADLFVTKLNQAGTGLAYSSYLGGGGNDAANNFFGNRIDVDAFGNAYVLGVSNSTNFPVFDFANAGGAAQGSNQTFVVKISADTPSYSIIGRLTTNLGAAIPSHGLSLLGANGFYRFTTTDAQGYYSLISLPAGDYVLTPDQFDVNGQFGFAPASRTFTGLSADQTADFIGTPLYRIQGSITSQVGGFGVAGVTVTLSGAATATTTTDLDGGYFFPNGFPNGNYTVTPSRPGYTFTPVNRTLSNLSADQTSVNFTTNSAQFFNVTGRVATVGNASVSGVNIVLVPGSFRLTGINGIITDVNGNYTISNVQADAGITLIPFKQALTFTPYNPTLPLLTGPTTLNFTAAPATGLTGQIAYTGFNQVSGSNEIYVANADGTGAVSITNDTFNDDMPGWSPDGAKLVFVSDRDEQVVNSLKNDIYTINADGTGLVRLTNNSTSSNLFLSDGDPAWSPGGGRIAFERGNLECSGADELVPVRLNAINTDGTNRAQLTNSQFMEGFPAWSPDGTKLSFARSTIPGDCSGDEGNIWVMNADGSAQTQLTNNGDDEVEPVWSPDGTKIAFVKSIETPLNFTRNIYVMNADGSGVTNLTQFFTDAASPTWSPDGSRIMFAGVIQFGPASGGNNIFAINTDGTGLTQIAQGPGGTVWRPDRNVQPANIGGQIADANGAPIGGATVTLGGAQANTTTTDANGFYAFRNIPRGGNYTVTPALAGRVFSPAQQSVNNLLGTSTVNFGSAALTVSVSGRVVDVNNPALGVSNVTVTLSGSTSATTTTDANGNYVFAGLAPGGNYTVTPARTNYLFESPAQSFNSVQTNQTADFIATLVYVISGRVTDGANGAGLSNVTITVSGTRTVVTTTDQNGNYAITIAAGGTYSVVATSPYNVFAPPRADFPNLSGPQTANFVTVPAATPTPTPPLSENFNSPTRDPEKFNLGTVSQDPESVDPLIPVVQRAGRLEITPRPNVDGEHFNGYVSVRPFDLTSGTAGVEVVQTATSTAQTIFGLGSDSQNNYRFVATKLGSLPPQMRAALLAAGIRPLLDATSLVLVFQVKIGGVITQQAIPYDPVAHRFWRFRHDAPVNAILFETSADNTAFTERYRKSLDKSVSALAVELTAGTAAPTTGGGTAVFDNLNIMTSSMQFATSSFSVAENAGSATLMVMRTGNIAGAATVDYTTMDDPAEIRCDDTANNHGTSYARCDYATSVDTLNFAPGETQKTLTIPIIDDSFVEGDETVRLILRNPAGAGLSSAVGAATLTIVDNDTSSNAPNPVFQTPFFVRQQYLDFLAREPEAGEPWSRVLNNCADVNTGPDVPSGCDRILVSGAFFGSPEFKDKGFYVIIFYRVAFNRLPAYVDFAPDLRSVTGTTPDESFAKRAAFARAFTQRAEFTTAYGGMSDAAYVAALLSRYQLSAITTPDPQQPDGVVNPDGTRTIQKVTLTQAQLAAGLTGGTLTRAQVLRAVVQSDQISQQAEATNAFVASQYYGYLRRTPDTGGFNGWVNYLGTHPGDFRTMVNGFVNSIEYRLRFGVSN